jgi:hypothetical protein
MPLLSTLRASDANGGVSNANKRKRKNSPGANHGSDKENNDNGADGDGIRRIPTPPRGIFQMSHGASERVLRDICHPIAREMFQHLDDNGYTLRLDGTYIRDFVAFSEEDCGVHALLYAQIDKATGKIIKIGLTTNLEFRTSFYEDRDKYLFIPVTHLHNFKAETDAFLQWNRICVFVATDVKRIASKLKDLLKLLLRLLKFLRSVSSSVRVTSIFLGRIQLVFDSLVQVRISVDCSQYGFPVVPVGMIIRFVAN